VAGYVPAITIKHSVFRILMQVFQIFINHPVAAAGTRHVRTLGVCFPHQAFLSMTFTTTFVVPAQ